MDSGRRYDRQIRIWGPHGQQRLESCQVALLNCGPTGSETLKNLVLGGIAGFTAVDGAKVCSADLGNNFMVHPDSIGESRAKVVTELLKEFNESVSGCYVEEDPQSLVRSNPSFFAQFTAVVATQMREQDLIPLDAVCRSYGVILMVVRSYGLCGYLRPSLPEHCIVESQPDNSLDDLRLNQPWPELKDYALSFDLGQVDDIIHRHIPFALLLIQASELWKAKHGGKLPSTSKERSAFKEDLRALKRSCNEVPLEEENFDEAEKAAFHVWSPYSIPPEVRSVLDDESAQPASVKPTTPVFWIMAAALKLFLDHEGHGQYLPLQGSIPDMHATTELYLHTQRVYRERAEGDVRAVEAHVQRLLAGVGREMGEISRATIQHYCKNARNLRVVRYRSLASEFSSSDFAQGSHSPHPPPPNSNSTGSTTSLHGSGPSHSLSMTPSGNGSLKGHVLSQSLLGEGTQAAASLYVLLRAVDRFHATHGRFPGAVLEQGLEEDVPILKALAIQVLSEVGAGGAPVTDDWVLEMVRFGAGELHVIAAFMGGMAAQEVIKLVTGQFTSATGSLIYNAVTATTACFEL